MTALMTGALLAGTAAVPKTISADTESAVAAEGMTEQEATGTTEEVIVNDPVEPEAPETPEPEEPEAPETEEPETPEAGAPETPETEEPEAPETEEPETPETEEPETPETEEPETPETEEPETPETEEPETPETEEPETPEAGKPETPEAGKPTTPETETPGTGNAGNSSNAGSGSEAAQMPNEESSSNKTSSYRDNRKDAYYEERSYNPSEAFLDRGEKIKYSTDMPLDNIPVFITPEMIIGALKVQDEYGYPASVTIAQIIQESGFGKYGPYGDEGQGLSYLAYQYNNLFGIKGTGPAGSVNMRTGEQTEDGTSYTIRAGFRVYHTYTESIEDRAELLERVYSDLIEGVNDANTFAVRIGGRWATDIDYAQSLISQMERYDLYRLDRMTLGEFSELLGDFADPCPGAHLTSTFGWRESTDSYHKGIDLGTGSENIPIYAAAAGTVVTAGYSDTAGNWIVIDHGDGLVTKYMHNEEMYVEEGDTVEKGQQIALSGSTGRSTGNHLHFQLEINGAAVDPLPYLYPEA